MNLEHLQAAKQRIEEIRRRFVDVQETAWSRAGDPSEPGSLSFQDALRRAGGGRPAPCPEELEPTIAQASARYGMDPAVIKSVIHVESGFRSNAVSRAGAQGLMQLMPGTARGLGVDPSDPAQNIDGGVRYLKQLVDRFGSLELGLAAYNAGPGAVERYGGIPPYAETKRYVSDVLDSISSYSTER